MRKLEGVIAAIQQAQTIAVVCHLSPDGDAVGTLLGVKRGLTRLGKQVAGFCHDPVPRNLRFLPDADSIQGPDAIGEQRFDLLLSVDCADFDRLGDCKALRDRTAHTAQIDHHGTNPGYMEENCVDGDASASALVAYELLTRLGAEIDLDIATCLFTGLSTDTGNFAFSCTTPEAFRVAGDLLWKGVPLAQIVRRMFRVKEAPAVALLGRALDSIRFYEDGRVTITKVTRKDMEECGALREHSEGIVNNGLDIPGVCVTCFLREDGDGTVKAAFRAIDGYRVDAIAHRFGGGGHMLASGASLTMSLAEAEEQVRAALIEEVRAH